MTTTLIHVTGAEALAVLADAEADTQWTVALTMSDGGNEHIIGGNTNFMRGAIAANDEIRWLKEF